MTICVKGKRQYVSTGRSVLPSKFSPKTQTVKGDKELNEFLKAMKARLYAIETTLLTKGITVTLDTILDVLRNGEEEKTITFLQVFDIHIENINKKVKRKLVTSTTLDKYEVTKGYISRFIKSELKKDDVLMKDVSPSFVENLFIYLLKFMTNNTAVQKMKQVKSVMRFAVEEGYIKVSPFKIVCRL